MDIHNVLLTYSNKMKGVFFFEIQNERTLRHLLIIFVSFSVFSSGIDTRDCMAILSNYCQKPQFRRKKYRVLKVNLENVWVQNLEEPMLVLKQTIPQQKALDLSFNLTPWKWAWHYRMGAMPSFPKITFFTPHGPMLFATRGHGMAPTFRVSNLSWDQGLSAEVSFVSVLLVVLSEYWKKLEKISRNKIISAIS